MQFQKFNEFIKSRALNELTNNPRLNRSALDYDRKLAQFNSRFNNPEEALQIVKTAGYDSVSDFINDARESKWAKLRIPGQGNYSS